jgi:hypothetical protein
MSKKSERHEHEHEAHETPAPRVVGPVQHETTDVEDIQALADQIVALVGTAAFDDMTWNEVEHALRRASSAVKQNWAATGTVSATGTPPVADAAAAAAAAPARAKAREDDEKPRYAG